MHTYIYVHTIYILHIVQKHLRVSCRHHDTLFLNNQHASVKNKDFLLHNHIIITEENEDS